MTKINVDEMTYEEAEVLELDLKQLFETKGWMHFLGILKLRADTRDREVADKIPTNTEQMVNFAIVKGGIAEMRFIPSLMEGIYTDTKEELRKRRDDMAAEQEQKEVVNG